MEFKHWNVLSFLNSDTKPCLSFGSTCLETDPNFTFLCGLGLLLLFLCYLVGIPFPTWKTKTTQKRQGRAKRRRKGGTLEDGRWYQREVEETRKLISILRSPLGRHHDTIQFRQRLCPDPSCEVCNSTTAEINRLLFLQALEDSTPLASTAPVTSSSFTLSPDFSAVPPGELIPASLPEPSPPPASIVSPNPVIPVADFFPPSPPGDSLPPEPCPPLDSKFPLDRFPAQPPAFPPPVPLHHAHSVDRGVQTETVALNTVFSPEPTLSQTVSPLRELSQRVNPTETFARHQAPPTRSASPPPDCHLTVTQSKPISISRKPVPESSPPQSSGGLSTYVPAITGIDPSSLSVLDLPHWQTHAKDFFPSTLAPRDFHQGPHSSEASSRGEPAANLVEPGNLSLLSPDAPALLEKQVQKRCDFVRGKETKGSFPRERIADKHELASPLPFWSSKDQSKELPMHQQRPYPTTLEEGHLQHTPIQFFWGLQTPHSESFPPAADASDNISNVSPEQESPVVPHPLPPSLPENPPQLLPQTQPLPSPHVQPQAHLQSPLPILPSGPLPDIKICGVRVHRPQNESQSLTSTETHHLEWNVLQKVQKHVWGLPTVVQRSQEDYCPSAPNPSLSHKATKAQVVISVPPGQFPLNEELRRKLESHLRKRLIQHRWRLPRRIYECLALMSGPRTLPQLPESQRHGGRSEISNKSQIRWTMSKSVYVEDPEGILPEDGGLAKYEDDLEKDQGHNPENDMGYDSEKELRSPSVKNSTVSVETMGQRQLENALKIHLRRKSEEISEGQLPGTVHNSWHTLKQTPLLSERSQTEIKRGSLPPSEVEDYSLNSFQERPFVEPSAAQKLEDHIKRLKKRVTWGLPPRVLESTQHFKSKESTYSLGGSLKSLHGDQAGTATSAPIPDHPLPATSTVGKEEQRLRRQSPSNITHQLAEDALKTKAGSQALTSVRQDTLGNRQPPRLPTRQGALRRGPKGKSANSGEGRGQQQDRNLKNPEPAVVPPESREIFRTKEFHTHQSQPSILTTDKPVSSQIIQGNEHQVKTTIPPNTPIPHDPKSLHVKEPLLHEFNLTLEDRERSQAQAPYTGLPPASDHLPYKASLTQGVSRGDTRASQVLHVHPEDTGITMEQHQEPWVPKHVLRRCQNKNPPPAAKAMWPPGSKAQERGGGDAGLGTCQPRTNRFPTEDGASKKRFPTQDAVWKVKLGSQPSQTLSQKGQLPPESLSQKGQPPSESLFRKKMRDFVQWLTPVIKDRRQENSQEKRSPLSSVESRGLLNGRAAFPVMPEAPKIMTAVGKFQEERMGRLRATGSTCPQQPIPSPTKFGKTQQKAQVPAQAQPVPGYPFNYRVPARKETNTRSCQQEAVFAGQGLIGSNRQLRNKDRQPQNVGAFKEQLPHQKYPLSVPLREPAPQRKTTCGHQAAQWPPATLTTPAGTVGKDVSLPLTASLLFTQETSPEFPGRGFGGAFPTPK